MSGIDYGEAGLEDAGDLLRLRRAFLESQIGFGLLDLPEDSESHMTASTRGLLRSPRAVVLLASAGGVAVGYAAAVMRVVPEGRERQVGQIDEVFVMEEARGLGIARTLVTLQLERFRAQGLGRIQIRALAANGRAQRLWESLGFRANVILMEYGPAGGGAA